jgi:Ca-activated chloride channel family protein
MKFQNYVIGVLSTLCIFLSLTPAYAAGPTQDLEIILDASGSMWAQIKGEAKISIAKRVLVDLVNSLKDRKDLALGIRVYGHQSHRKEKNCKDTKLEIPFGPPNPAKARALMKRVNAQGQTPIAYSLLEAKKDFDLAAKRKRTIILITDGLESCDGDPCKVAKQLAAAGVGAKLNVVGFDLGPAEMAKLKCLVVPSGGLLLAARDAAQLKKALGEVIKKALGGLLRVVALKENKPIRGAIEVYPAGGRERIVLDRTATKDTDPGTELKAGVYDVKVIDEEIESRPTVTLTGIKIEGGKTVEKKVDFSGGAIKITALLNDKPFTAKIHVYKKDTGEEVASTDTSVSNPQIVKILPGIYDVKVGDQWRMEQEPSITYSAVQIDPAKTVEKVARFSEGYLKVGATKGGGPLDASIVVYKQGTRDKQASSDTSADNPETINLVPGVYDVKVVDAWGTDEVKEFKGIAIEAQGTKSINAAF